MLLRPACLTLLACLVAAPLGAQQQPAPTAQQQIDELKAAQQRMQKDLDEIKALLKEGPGRVESPRRQPPTEITMNVYGEPFRGQAGARVAILEYSDFDCSYCARYATQIYPQIEAAYIKTGKLKYFFHDLPMVKEHANALFKARIARCAGEQDRFWEMHDKLFAEQKPLDEMDLPKLMKSVGLDTEKMGVCLATDRYADIIMRSATLAERSGVTGTPAFLIGTLSEDGRLLRATKVFFGADSFDVFKKVLDELLAPTSVAR